MEDYKEVEVNLQRRFVRLDVAMLKVAYEMRQAEVEGILTDPPLPVEEDKTEKSSTEFYPGIMIQLPCLHLPTQVQSFTTFLQ